MNKYTMKFILLIFLLCCLDAQKLNEERKLSNNPQSLKRVYTSDIAGNLYMNINIWGSENSSGRLQVSEGVDMVDILSIIGGPTEDNNYKKIKIIRENLDENNNRIIFVDMSEFFKKGDKSNLPKVLPNDTIIIKKKLGYYIFDKLGELSTTITILTIILNLFLIR